MNKYRLTKPLKVLEWLLTFFSISAAAVMSQGYWEGYYIYLVANMSGLILFYNTKWWPSFCRQALFTCTTIVGIYNTLL
jgi:hypothetical protein